jgi:hypothetical protein
MHEIIFEPDFWPNLHIKVQNIKAASDLHMGYNFWEGLAKAISILSVHNIDMLRVNFDKFPLVTGASNAQTRDRHISVSTIDCLMEDIKLRWRIEGEKIRIIGIVFPQGYTANYI